MEAIQQVLQLQYPKDVQVQLEPRTAPSPVNILLHTAEAYFKAVTGKSIRLRLVWIYGGGARVEYLTAGDDVFLVQGDIDLRLRSSMHAILTGNSDPAEHSNSAFRLSSRIAAELARYGKPEKLIRILSSPTTAPIEIPPVSAFEATPRGITYLARWCLGIAHEAGHYWADKLMDQSLHDAHSPIRALLADKCATLGLDLDDHSSLFHEATADAFAAEVFWTLVSHMRELAGHQLDADELRLEAKQAVFELVVHYRILAWRQTVADVVAGASPEAPSIARQALMVRELMTIDQFAFNRGEEEHPLLTPDEIKAQWKSDIEDLSETKSVAYESVAVRSLLSDVAGPACPEDELANRLEWFYLDTAPPAEKAVEELIEKTGARPLYYQPAPRKSWWSGRTTS